MRTALRRHPATVIAAVALFSSMLGTATATRVLVVKDSAETAKKKKKKPKRGPKGPAGPAGSDATFNGVAAGGDLAGSYPNPTLRAGAITPAQFGTIPAVRAHHSASINVANVTSVVLPFNSEAFDTAAMHSTGANNSRLVAPITGIYQVSGHVNWQNQATGQRIIDLYRNGVMLETLAAEPNNANNTQIQPFASLIQLTAGQYVQLFLYQDSTVQITATPDEFSMHWVGP